MPRLEVAAALDEFKLGVVAVVVFVSTDDDGRGGGISTAAHLDAAAIWLCLDSLSMELKPVVVNEKLVSRISE